MPKTIVADVLEILVCPQDKQFLYYQPNIAFYNPRLQIKYPIVSGIPMLLTQQAITVTDEEEKHFLESGEKTGNKA